MGILSYGDAAHTERGGQGCSEGGGEKERGKGERIGMERITNGLFLRMKRLNFK